MVLIGAADEMRKMHVEKAQLWFTTWIQKRHTSFLPTSTVKNEGLVHEEESLDFGEHYESWANEKLLGLSENRQ